MNWFKSAWDFLRKMPVGRWLRPGWLKLAEALVQRQGDELQRRIHAAIAKEGPRAVDRNIDKWQKDLIAGIEALPLPDGIEDAMQEAVQKHGDEWQGKLADAVAAGGPKGFDVMFDAFQAALLAKIAAL